MSNEETIWIGQDGQKLGPYTEADVRKWTSEGRFAADALAWHEGLADWVPLSTLFKDMQPPAPPPIPPAPSVTSAGPGFAASPASSFTASSAERYAEPTYATHDPDEAARADLPMPPSLHWGWVLVLSVLTLGIFGLIWVLVQANWVRKIDPESKALAALIASIVCFVVGESISMTGSAEARAGIPHSLALSAFGLLLVLAYLVLYLYGVFSMAGSMRRRMSDDGLTPDIGGVTLFFFNTFYLQGQMSWLARWKNTGATTPPPPKGLFYLLWLLFPIVIAILAAISIPAYQSYLVRSQVSEGMVLADGLKPTLLAYYNTHNNTLPASNAVAGLPDKITGRYVSDINIYNGTMTIEYANPASNAMIQQKVIVLAQMVNQGTLSWKCTSDSTVPVSELPLACRKP